MLPQTHLSLIPLAGGAGSSEPANPLCVQSHARGMRDTADDAEQGAQQVA